MPLVRVSLVEGKPPSYHAAVGEAIHRAMVATINVPPDDRFQVFSEHAAGEIVFDRGYLGIARGEEIVVIHITLNSGRTVDQKRALYRAIADNLARDPGVRKEDIVISLTEVAKEDWSFGKGEMSYSKG